MGSSPSQNLVADFVMGGFAAAVAKSAAAPIERVKLLLQNQGELQKRGHLCHPYRGVGDCFRRVLREEGILSLWRGNQANVLRYLPTQVHFPLMTSVFPCIPSAWSLLPFRIGTTMRSLSPPLTSYK